MDTSPGIFSTEPAKISITEGLNMANFAFPVIGVSFVLALILLSSPSPFLGVFGKLLAKGYVIWIVGGLTSATNVATYLVSLGGKFSSRHIWMVAGLLSATCLLLIFSVAFLASTKSASAEPLSTHVVVEQLSLYYFTLVAAIFFPCPILLKLSEAFESLFDKDSQNPDQPAPLPG
jgi:hypothetical protein